MTAVATQPAKKWTATWVLGALGIVVVAVALLTPEEAGTNGRDMSTFSTGPGGAGIAFELAERMGWKPERRIVPLDSTARAHRVDVVLAPSVALGSHEVHRLLDNVRAGGGLIASLDGDDELADSLGVEGGNGAALLDATAADCPDDRLSAARAFLSIPPDAREVDAPKHASGAVVTLLSANRPRGGAPVVGAIGFPLGAGRVVVVGSSAVFGNAAVRYCRWDADLAVARMLAFVRPANDAHPAVVFDEYHHGYGVHGGSLRAAAVYLGRTSSGHFLVQALVAGLLLLLAKAPRPLPPRDVGPIQRRSPIEHADALGRAFEDVGATRTATARLLGGVRRRIGRAVAVSSGGGATDDEFLKVVERTNPQLSDSVRQIRNALEQAVAPQQFSLAGTALERIERALTRDESPSPRT
jgi:uncharacterized protein DUF4350